MLTRCQTLSWRNINSHGPAVGHGFTTGLVPLLIISLWCDTNAYYQHMEMPLNTWRCLSIWERTSGRALTNGRVLISYRHISRGFMQPSVSVNAWLCLPPIMRTVLLQGRENTEVTAIEYKTKEKTTPFGVNSMRSQVLYRAAQESQPFNVYAGMELQLS